ncbi:MAG: 7-cyano-7-deazaguanine synthase [Phycisphaerae bacterium]|nr:7-cyano-7-deazaguanine synthase [Phycisphaerae bacterium]
MERAIILLSGGLNSAVALASLRQTYEQFPLFVNLYQRPAEREARAFEQLCAHFEASHNWTVELSHFKQVGGNAYVDPQKKVESVEQLGKDIAGTYVAMLMPTLLDIAATFAFRVGAQHIVVGLSEAINQPEPGISVLYPDNSRGFIFNYQHMLETALPRRTRLTVQTPLIDFDRREIVLLGQRCKVPFELTWSCYQNSEQPCGRCFGCVSRATGFIAAQLPDPLVQKKTPA